MTGMTLHQVTQKLDVDKVVHQRGASLFSGYGLHVLVARTTRDFFDETIPLISSCVQKNLFSAGFERKGPGEFGSNPIGGPNIWKSLMACLMIRWLTPIWQVI